MTDTNLHPQTLSGLREKFLRDVLNSAIVCMLVAALFWATGFGVAASPSVPRLLVTVTLPAFIVGDWIRYQLATRKYGFIGQVPMRESTA